jgi:hypothetical protein
MFVASWDKSPLASRAAHFNEAWHSIWRIARAGILYFIDPCSSIMDIAGSAEKILPIRNHFSDAAPIRLLQFSKSRSEEGAPRSAPRLAASRWTLVESRRGRVCT